MAKITVLDPKYVGTTYNYVDGYAVPVPARRTSGWLWWKRTVTGFAVQVVELRWGNDPIEIDVERVWVTRGFYLTRRGAQAECDRISRMAYGTLDMWEGLR